MIRIKVHLLMYVFGQILSQDMLKKYITYAKLNVFPKLHDADLDKLTHVYAELRRESSVRLFPALYICMIVHWNSYLALIITSICFLPFTSLVTDAARSRSSYSSPPY